MEGFEKINLDGPVNVPNNLPNSTPAPKKSEAVSAPLDMPGRKTKFNFKNHKRLLTAVIVVVLLLVVSVFTIVLPAEKTYKAAKKTYAQVQLTVDALKKQNVTLASTQLDQTKADLTETQKDLQAMSYLRFVPVANWYYSDATHLMNAGFDALGAARVLIDSIQPYADVLGLKGQGSFVGGSASQRIETAVKTMGKITPNIDKISTYLVAAKTEIDAVDPNHYPGIGPGAKVKTDLQKVKTLTDEGVTFIDQAKPLIKILPQLLGEPNETKYLVIFQNDKELRPTGGFITAYAIFRLDQGVIHVDVSNDIYTLDATIPNKQPAPKPIAKYLDVPLFNLRDSNLSPDFVTSMNTFYSMYKTSPSYEKVDGIIAVDTSALVSAMNILGDIQADGVTFTTKNEPICDCPQVIYQLESFVDTRTNKVVENRKGIIGDLMYAIMSKAFSSSPKVYWGPLFQTMLTETSQKHILFYSFNSDAESGLEALNASGRILPFNGDYLHINEANFGGAKSNMFVSENVLQNYQVTSDGTITKTVTINYKNPYPPSNCSLTAPGLCLNAPLRDWFRIYVPQGSQLVSSQGSEVKLTSYNELGKTVFEGFLTVNPEGIAKFTITYTLPFRLAANSTLPVLIQKQPGTNGNDYVIQVNGKQVQEFPLLTDKTLTLNLH